MIYRMVHSLGLGGAQVVRSLFGHRFWKGLLAVWAGGAVGQSLSFLLARYLVKDMVATYVAKKWSKWDLVEHVLVTDAICCFHVRIRGEALDTLHFPRRRMLPSVVRTYTINGTPLGNTDHKSCLACRI